MNKSELRETYLQKRKLLTDAEYLNKCNSICNQFFSIIDLSFVKVIHSFLPIIANKEPDTWLIIDRIRREFPGIRLSVPRINRQTDHLDNFFFEGLHQLEENNWGIKQPKQGVPTDADKIDMVLVPLLVFSNDGHRVGYGKGYYDRFLSTCREDCKKIGLSLFPPVDTIPSEPSDVKLDYCITPEKLYEFN